MARERRYRPGRRQGTPLLPGTPFQVLRNPLPPVELFHQEQLERIHQASMRILEEVGIDFWDEEALELWQGAGARVDRGQRHVWIERGLLLELVRRAPAQFNLHARNPAYDLPVGGNAINFVTVGGAPFYSDLEQGRRPGTLADFCTMVKLAQQCGPLHVVEGLLLEPQDLPVPVRHLEKGFHQLTLSDKVYHTASHGRQVAQDYLQMAAIVFGGLERIRERPVFASVVNANSPLRFDQGMLGGLITYARHGQPPIITPFILAGAMSPMPLASALAQGNAEALAGVALTQIVNPGCPVVYGGFTTPLDMKSGGPAFGTPEGALALLAGAQLARHYGLPYRGSGGLNNAKLPDAQAAAETLMTLWPAVLAHANIILHSAGWLEAGLVCSLEKFVLDVEGLAIMQRLLAGIEVNEESLALEEIAAVGPGGHHLGTDHTLARFRTEFYLPLASDRQNYQNWLEDGALDAAQRAHRVAQTLLQAYETPPMDAAVAQELQEFVTRRSRQLMPASP